MFKYHYKGRFVVVNDAGAYLADDRRPDPNRSREPWTTDRTQAKTYKLHIWAFRAAKRWGGSVRQEQ